MKKVISIFLSLCIIVSSFTFTSLSTFAAGNTTISSSSITANAGQSVSVPVYINNNIGLMGYVLEFEYDNTVLTPIDVTRGTTMTSGNFNDDIEGSTSTENSFKVMWNNSSNSTENGLLFYINFKVNANAIGTTELKIGYDSSDTYDEDFNDVVLTCSSSNIAISNSTYNSSPRITLSSNVSAIEIEDNVTFVIDLLNISTLKSLDLCVDYDEDNFDFVSSTDSGINDNGKINYSFSNVTNGKLAEFTLKAKKYATSKTYNFTATASNFTGVSNVYVSGCSVSINKSDLSDLTVICSDDNLIFNEGISQITIPVYIQHNTGIMGYKLMFDYDASQLEIVSANPYGSFSNNANNSIGNKSGSFYCIWFDNEDVVENGKMIELTFNVIATNEITSTISISYSQADTFNEQNDDVKLVCENIDVLINHVHNYNDWTIIKNPTCTETGSKKHDCKVCGYEETQTINSNGHTVVTDKAVTPTCTATGLTEGSHCSVCNTVLVAQTVVKATGHTVVTDEAVAPTCTATGLTEGSHCSVCNTVLVKQNTVNAKGHTVVIDKAVAPTCTATGLTEGSHCSVCNTVLVRQNTVNAKGHTVVTDKAVAPTCTATGLTEGSHCSVCNEVLTTQKVTDALGHNYSTKVTESTCTEQGYTTYTCSRCGDTYRSDYVAANGHTVVTDKAVSATCTKSGLTEGSHCSVCDVVFVEQNNVKALGHSFTNYVNNNDATCTENATETAECDRCDAIDTKVVENSAKGHTYKTYTTKATTSKNGSLVTKCACGDIKSTTTIYYPKTINLSTTKYTYDGKVKKPSIKVVDSKGKTISTSNYTVTYPSGRKNVGKYTVKITFKGNYSGTVSKTFTIVPKTTSISSLTAASKGFTVKWKKQATQTTGYQIQIATDSKFTKGVKSYTVSKNSTVSKKITKLTGKKKYYVRIRTYKTVSGTKYYSSWSGSKSVTTKK